MVKLATIIISDSLHGKTVSRALLVLYSSLLAVALVLTSPWWLWQMVRTGKYREGLAERLGRIPTRLRSPQHGSIWVHAVSVGEVLAAARLIENLGHAQAQPVYISTTTRTGQALARERFGAAWVFYFPLDFAFTMRAWLRFLRPSLVVLVESEFWPRMLAECQRSAIPVAVVNARISDRSWPRYQRLRRLWRPLLGSLALVLAQSERDAQRLRTLGATGASDGGNLKYDIRASASSPLVARLQERLPAAIPVVVCGSTLAGEEALLLDALPLGRSIVILAPRHPERFDEVACLLADRAIPFVRRSTWAMPRAADQAAAFDLATLAAGSVLLLDSIGELASLYSLATIAVIGGGFLFTGGHNPLEAAQFGAPVLIGTRYDNFRDVVETLKAERAIVLSDPAGLLTTLGNLLADEPRRRAIGERGRRVFDRQAGATAHAVAALTRLLVQSSPVQKARP